MSISLTHSSPSCNSRWLNCYLDGDLLQEERRWVEDHLNGCDRCVREMQELAANQELWTEAAFALETGIASESQLRPRVDLSLNALAMSDHFSSNDSQDSRLSFPDHLSESTEGQKQMLQRWLDPSETVGSMGKIGKYEIHGIAGQGGMGLVLKATDTELNRLVALKTMAHHVTARADARSRLAREARAVAALRHPNVISIFGLETWRDVPLIVMPFVEGGTLQQFASKQRLTVEQLILCGLQIAHALSCLHASGIVHRDLKPSNILLQDELEHLLLSDFGLARQDGDECITQSDAMAGTPYFMSPEQALGKPINTKSDLFSFGCVLFWLATGEYPFQGGSNYETLSLLVHSQPNNGLLIRSQLPEYMQRIIHRLLSKNPDERWSSIDQVIQLLNACLEHNRSALFPLTLELQTSASPNKQGLRWLRRIGIGLLMATVSGYATFSIWSGTLAQRPQHGSLDRSDRQRMLEELNLGRNESYWLGRLGQLSVDEIPHEALPAIQLFEQHSDPKIRELAGAILAKNPFVEVVRPTDPQPGEGTPENPFKEVSTTE